MRYLIDAKALEAPQERDRFVVENVIFLNRPILGRGGIANDRAAIEPRSLVIDEMTA